MLIKCTSIEQAEEFSRAILIVAKSKNKGEPFKKHKTYLDEAISGQQSPLEEIQNVHQDDSLETNMESILQLDQIESHVTGIFLLFLSSDSINKIICIETADLFIIRSDEICISISEYVRSQFLSINAYISTLLVLISFV